MSTSQLQLLILVILLLMAISLLRSLYLLFKDNGDPKSKRTYHSLVVRVTLATALLSTMIYGFYTGKLQSHAPWNNPAVLQQQPVQK
ncbi:MAG TPA: DUF2909 domain-containing protein [Pseudomonadales bacterium]|jgi:formate-dependent nitrite reductase membrane component NrfD|nr:DUF2909 domain-containing protein [Pseudomonadales bacterium]